MPKTKGPNPKKMAAQTYGSMKALAAAQQGEYEIALVEKALGFCQFRAHLQTDGREVTVLVRGKNKGGAACPTRVEPGVYVIVDGDPGKMMEVMGVVNRQAALDKLRGAGRVKKAKEETDDLFEEDESSGAVAAGANLWAKRDEEREEMAQALVRRYQRREAEGGKARLAAAERVTKVAEVDAAGGAGAAEDVEEEVDIADYLGLADGEGSPKKGITSKRRLAAMAARAAEAEAEAATAKALADAEAAAWRAMAAAADDDGGVWSGAAQPLKPLEPFSKGKSWEEAADELDIDKI